jgi:hypothetical protein
VLRERKEQETGGIMHYEELYDLYCTFNVIRVIK